MPWRPIADSKRTVRFHQELGVRTPLIDAVYSVLYESKPPMEALVELMTRDPRPELD